MTFEEYQKKSRETARYPDPGKNFVYPTLGLVGEAGEVAGKISKILRDKGGKLGEEDREELKRELGDVLWYLVQIATELGLSFGEVAEANLEKLHSRLERNQIHGSGDNR